MKKFILLGLTLLSMTIVSPALAQHNNPLSISDARPTTSFSFRSTGTMLGSGSAYASTPMLNADGTAPAPYAAPSSPRRVRMEENDDDISMVTPGQSGSQAPIGDAVIPLLIMALIYMIVAYRRKTKVSDLCI